MAVIFDYAVLVATPDSKRGERVNVGIMVFLPDCLDIRMSELAKLRALTGRDWEGYGRSMAKTLSADYAQGDISKETFVKEPRLDKVIRLSALAKFAVKDDASYESRVKDLLASLVSKPKADEARVRNTRINTEITLHLKRLKILGTPTEEAETHKVFKNLDIDDGLRADFWQKNGVMRVTSTIDFRRPVADMKEAALKSVVLDQAEKKFGSDLKRFGVYAARSIDEIAAKPGLHLFGSYADALFNWESLSDKRKFVDVILSGMAPGQELMQRSLG